MTKNKLTTSIEVPTVEEAVEAGVLNLDSLGRAYGTGRRKHAVARLWLSNGNEFKVFKKSLKDYFQQESMVDIVLTPFKVLEMKGGKVFCTVKGGGKVSQAEAIRLALAKAILIFDPSSKEVLKQHKLLTTDARRKEREHVGFRTSRKPQQYRRR